MPTAISAIEIENFKAIGERQRIELKPITLLFGPNSGGKSTIIQAIHYLREIVCRNNPDATLTESGGDFVNLGGFRNFVHQRDINRPVRIKAEFEAHYKLPKYLSDSDSNSNIVDSVEFRGEVKKASVEIEVRWNSLHNVAYVSQYSVGINGVNLAAIVHKPLEPEAQIESQKERHVSPNRFTYLSDVNFKHPIFEWLSLNAAAELEPLEELISPDESGSVWEEIDLPRGALPPWGEILWPSWHRDWEDREDKPLRSIWKSILSQLIVAPGELLKKLLDDFRYIGPMREIPPRNYRPSHYPDISRWPSGLAAWDALSKEIPKFVKDEVSLWLSGDGRGDRRLGTGYRLSLERQKSINRDHELIRKLESEDPFYDFEVGDLRRLLRQLPEIVIVWLEEIASGIKFAPSDTGIGLSQIVPVVVALLVDVENAPGVIAIEQPELHIHPRIQAALGDLLIHFASGHPAYREISPFMRTMMCPRERTGPACCIIESHSEHLLLRLLRRIRQTNDNELPEASLWLTPEGISVVYVDPHASKHEDRIKMLRINEAGEFLDHWPQGFFEERAEELFE
jgi:hypothetical protein